MSQHPSDGHPGPDLHKQRAPGSTESAAPQTGPQQQAPFPPVGPHGPSGPQFPPPQPGPAGPVGQQPGAQQPVPPQHGPQGPFGQQPGGPPPQSGPQGPGQAYPPVGYQGGPGYAQGAVSPADARTWSIAAHVGGPVVALVTGGSLHWIPALVIYLIYKDRSPFIRQHATEALNFQITLLIAYAVCFVVTILTLGIGAVLYLVPWILSIVFGIMGAMAANRGEAYRYPVNLRLVS